VPKVLQRLHDWLAERGISYSAELDQLFQQADRQAGVADLAIKLNDANARTKQGGGTVDRIDGKLAERNGRPAWYLMYYGRGKHKGTFFIFFGDLPDITSRLEMAVIMKK
jgi:hypothetical protein